jgi:hypothetical protein
MRSFFEFQIWFIFEVSLRAQRLPWRPPRHAVPQAREAICLNENKRLLR